MSSNRRGARLGRTTIALMAVLGTVVAVLAASTAASAAAGTPPKVTSLSPSFGPLAGGTKVTVFGHHFTHVQSVTFGGIGATSLHVVSPSMLTVRAPAHSHQTVGVHVQTRAGTSPASGFARYAYTNRGLISGTVTAKSTGQPLNNVDVLLFDHGNYLTDALTNPDGSYQLRRLVASDNYVVCFSTAYVRTGPATGYADECYKRRPWNGRLDSVPQGTVQIDLPKGGFADAIGAALPTAAGISGTVTAADDGTPLSGVGVTAIYPGRAAAAGFAQTDEDGQYTVLGLRQHAPGYMICFDGTSATGGPSNAGYSDQCYDSTAWDGSISDVPPDATAAPVSAGAVTPDIDAALDSAPTLAGSVTAN